MFFLQNQIIHKKHVNVFDFLIVIILLFQYELTYLYQRLSYILFSKCPFLQCLFSFFLSFIFLELVRDNNRTEGDLFFYLFIKSI